MPDKISIYKYSIRLDIFIQKLLFRFVENLFNKLFWTSIEITIDAIFLPISQFIVDVLSEIRVEVDITEYEKVILSIAFC